MALKKTILVAYILYSITACSGFKESNFLGSLDEFIFKHWGVTVFSKIHIRPILQIHLNQNNLAGDKVIVEGKVVRRGEHSTFLVLEGKNKSNLLIIMVNSSGEKGEISKGSTLRVLGRLVTKPYGSLSLDAHIFKKII